MIKELTEIELEGHETMNRWEKMEFLEETTTVETHTKSILNELGNLPELQRT